MSIEKSSALSGPKHRSPSQWNCLAACEAKYWYRYIRRLKKPLSSALLLGRATDEAFQLNFQTKMSAGRDEKLAVVQEKYVAEFESGVDAVDWRADEERPVDLRDSGMKPLAKYHREVCPGIRPVEVQPDFGMECKALGIHVVQFGDVLTVDHIIIDQKTSRSSPPNGANGLPRAKSEDHEFQGISYAIGHKARLGIPPAKMRIDYLVRTKEPKIVHATVATGPTQVAYFEAVTDRMERRLQWLNSVEWKTALPNRRHLLCSRKWCEYWRECEKDFGGAVKE